MRLFCILLVAASSTLAGCYGYDQHAFHFVETPSDTWASQGDAVALKCRAVGGNAEYVRYRWTHNGSEVRPDDLRRRSRTNGNLYIRRADHLADEGEYRCEAELNGERLTSNPGTVRISWLDSDISVALVQPERASLIASTREITLRCRVNGTADLKISWLRNGERIVNSPRITMEKDALRVKGLTSVDNGVYRCEAFNRAGSIRSIKNFVLSVPSDNWSPTVRVVPEDQIVKEGTSARIDCVYQNADVMEWYFQETGPLDNSTRFTVLANGSLVVNNMSKINEGIYACVGIKQESAAVPQKYTARLYVAALAGMNSTFLDPSDAASHMVRQGGNFEIRCHPPFGRPPPVIRWIGPSGDIVAAAGRVRAEGRVLRVLDANAKFDAGRYSCRAENLAGSREVFFNLTVAVAPFIKRDPRSQNANEGSNVWLHCEYVGSPYPFTRVVWIKDEVPLPANTSRVHVDTSNGTLHLRRVELNDAGNYYCVVNTTSYEPLKSRFAALNVEQKLKFHPLPMGKKMELGMTHKVPCKAEGKDVPVVRWIKGNSLANAEPFPQNVQDVNGTLHFNNVQKQDVGQYTCIATNSQGEISVVIDVDVVVTPKFVVLPKNPTEGYNGYPVLLNCSAEGDPTPTIQWDNKNVDMTQKRFHQLPNGSLLIDEVHFSDEGYYGCTAGNSGGFNRTEVTLIVRSLRSDGTVDELEGDTVGKTVVITLGAACAYILLVVILMAWCRYRRKKKKQAYMSANADSMHIDDETSIGKYSARNPVELKETVVVQNGESICLRTENSANGHTSGRLMKIPNSVHEHMNFPRKNIHNIMLLGKGEFGDVYLAQNSQNDDAVVMVKVLEESGDEFERQLDILTHVEHDHLVKLVGLCREVQPLYMILEYTDWGDLKQFLIATRKSSVGVVGNKERPAPLTLKQILTIAKQIASALECLTSKNYTHRDVAARNCLITSGLSAKITFASLCKTNYVVEYYSRRDQLLPLRWLPLEAVVDDQFSAATDVYSFAVLVWEVFTKAELPFSKQSNKEFLTLLQKRQVQWKLPKSMPPQVGQLLRACWSVSPADRPSFARITDELRNLVSAE